MPLIYYRKYRGPLSYTGFLFTWGNSARGALGNNQWFISVSSPIQIGSERWKTVGGAAGFAHFGIRDTGELFMWGAGNSGVLGLITDTDDRSSPTQVGSDVWTTGATFSHTLMIKSDGTLWVWGLGAAGQLGQNNIVSRSSPVQLGSDTWTFASVGSNYSHAIRSDGTLWGWGGNGGGSGAGYIGDTTGVDRSSPVQISVGQTFIWVSGTKAGGTVHAIQADGSLWTWGANPDGLQGRNSNNVLDRTTSPRLVSGSSDWVMVEHGSGGHAVGIKNNGTLWSWGSNISGQLGQGDTFVSVFDTKSRSSPTQIGADTDWAVAWAGNRFSMALKTDGTLWAWGENGQGQLGDGTTANRSSPVQIGSATNWFNVRAGGGAGGHSSIGLRRNT